MSKEEILLQELNRLGDFENVEQEFNIYQLEAIYNAMEEYVNKINYDRV